MFLMMGLFNISVLNAERNMPMYLTRGLLTATVYVYAKIIKGVSREPFRQKLLENLSAIIALNG